MSDCSYVTASDAEVFSDQYNDDDDDDDMMMTSAPHPLLEADLARVAEKFGPTAVEYKSVCLSVHVLYMSVCVCTPV